MRIFEVPAKRIILSHILQKEADCFLNKNIFEKCICNECIFKVLLYCKSNIEGGNSIIFNKCNGDNILGRHFLSLLRSLRLG